MNGRIKLHVFDAPRTQRPLRRAALGVRPMSTVGFGSFGPIGAVRPNWFLRVCLTALIAGVGFAAVGRSQTYPPPVLAPGETLVPDSARIVPSRPPALSTVPMEPSESTGDGGGLVEQSRGDRPLSVPPSLRNIVRYGGVPSDLSTLRLLERQQQRVSALASRCTVNVQIGPAQGCGVIITASGYVLTAAHVAMRPGKTAIVTMSDGRTVRATTLGLDRNFDAGLLRINPGQGATWPHASLGTSTGLVAGMWCVATGHPGGYDPARGPVTRVGRILATRPSSLLTDCALIGGDSGGPLFDLGGQLIAIHSRIGNDVAENLHVPIDRYEKSWERMAAGESWGFLPGFRPVLGVRGRGRDAEAIVAVVREGSPADLAGMLPGDIIDSFNDRRIKDFDELRRAVADTMPGERVEIWFRRDGQSRRLRLEIGRADDD